MSCYSGGMNVTTCFGAEAKDVQLLGQAGMQDSHSTCSVYWTCYDDLMRFSGNDNGIVGGRYLYQLRPYQKQEVLPVNCCRISSMNSALIVLIRLCICASIKCAEACGTAGVGAKE